MDWIPTFLCHLCDTETTEGKLLGCCAPAIPGGDRFTVTVCNGCHHNVTARGECVVCPRVKTARDYAAWISDAELIAMWRQYGRPAQAAHYRGFARRAYATEMLRRGLSLIDRPAAMGRPRGYGPGGDKWLWMWGIGGGVPMPARVARLAHERGAK